MSIVSGPISGLLSGVRSGLNPSYGANPMAGVTQDATSSKYVPANATEWNTTRAAAGISSGNPTSLYLCQEGSGNLADTLSTNTLTPFNNPTYAQAVTGWTRTAVGSNDGSDAFTCSTIGNPAAESYLVLAYIKLTGVPGATAPVLSVGSGAGVADRRHAAATTAPVYNARDFNAATINVNGTSDPSTTVRPVVLLINRAGSEFSVLTDQDKILTSWTAPSSGTNSYFSIADGCPACQFLYVALFSGAAAELTRTQIKTLLTTLGWSIAWSP